MVSIIVEIVPPVYLCCDTLIAAEDIASASRFQNERRRTEHLAWRRVVRREFGMDIHISYNAVGAPVVDRPNTWISVAHSNGLVAIAVADEKVGIDIEPIERDAECVKSKFMSTEEISLSDDSHWAVYVWTAKEAMYKLYGRRGVELRDGLKIEMFDSATMTMRGSLIGETRKALVQISLREGDMVVAVATFEGV